MASGAGAIDRPVLPLSPGYGKGRAGSVAKTRPGGDTDFALDRSRRALQPRRQARLRRLWQILAREGVGAWLGPVLLAAALSALYLAGAFRLADGLLFDAITIRERGLSPRVVLIEQSPQGAAQQAALERRLAQLGVRRIGYLSPRASNIAPPPSAARGFAGPPVIHALGVRPIPASDKWQLAGTVPPGVEAAARIAPLSEYGIYRGHRSSIAGQAGAIPTFEARLAGREAVPGDFLVRMPRGQNIPTFSADQLIDGHLRRGELSGLVAIVAPPDALVPRYATPLTPGAQGTSEARLRSLAVQSLVTGHEVHRSSPWEAALLLLIAALVPALGYSRIDPKRFAVALPMGASVLVLAGGLAAIQLADKLPPVTALLLVPWIVTFQRVLLREASQDRRLERSAARAMQHSFVRSALRDGARLPEYLGTAARIAGIGQCLLIEQLPGGRIVEVNAKAASLDDLDADPRSLAHAFDRLRGSSLSIAAQQFVPGWGCAARMSWLGTARGDLFWIHGVPQTPFLRKSQRLVRAMTASFREFFRWRADLNARARHDERHAPIDDRVASAIALISRESEQVHHGIDALDTAVAIFHLIGSPLHANASMREIFRAAGLGLGDADLPTALLHLTDLDEARIDAAIQNLLLNGGEMRIPMRELGRGERLIRLAVPERLGKREGRVLVIEAIDVASLNRAADLRQAVATYIDAQLRNDLEAILLGADLAMDPRIKGEQLKPLVGRIAEIARRGTGRLNEVTGLTRASSSQTAEVCYPLDARRLVLEARSQVAEFAQELAVGIDADIPGISGFTMAEPRALVEMLGAMLRVVLADTPRGESVTLRLEELDGHTRIRIAGGFGIAFERLVELLSKSPDAAVGDFRLVAEGMAKALQWDASVSYWGREADGFGFTVDLRRIG